MNDKQFLSFIKDTLISDVRESGQEQTAEDIARLLGLFETVAKALERLSLEVEGDLADLQEESVSSHQYAIVESGKSIRLLKSLGVGFYCSETSSADSREHLLWIVRHPVYDGCGQAIDARVLAEAKLILAEDDK